MIIYRHYHSGDESNIVELWNECLPVDPITSARFRNLILLDANFDPNGLRLAFKENKLVGCVYVVRRLLPMFGTDLEPDNGWMLFFFVGEQNRKSGVGSQLMEDAISFFKENSRSNIFFASYVPNYILPGIDEAIYPEAYHFLIEQGFEKHHSLIAMDRNLIDFQLSQDIKDLKEKRESEGYSFAQAEDKDLYELIQFANKTFNPDWGRAIREGVLQGIPLHRILVARDQNKLVGFCIYGGHEGITERFGPFGVDPDQQGKGLGKLILNLCLQQMKAEGLHTAWFLWTSEKTSAGYLYKKAGFEISRTFHVMKKGI